MINSGLRVTCIGSDDLVELSSEVKQCIDEYMELKAEFIISDSGPFSELVQRYLKEHKYRNVKIAVVDLNYINRVAVKNFGGWEEIHFCVYVNQRTNVTARMQRLKYRYIFLNCDDVIAVWVNGSGSPKYRDLYKLKTGDHIYEFSINQPTQEELDEAYYAEHLTEYLKEYSKSQSRKNKKMRRKELCRLLRCGHFFF